MCMGKEPDRMEKMTDPRIKERFLYLVVPLAYAIKIPPDAELEIGLDMVLSFINDRFPEANLQKSGHPNFLLQRTFPWLERLHMEMGNGRLNPSTVRNFSHRKIRLDAGNGAN